MQVLIVDDDIVTVDVIKSKIAWERLGVQKVLEAFNVEGAKKILMKESIDIIISDIEMPRASGIDLLNWFREQGMRGEFLFLTCHERFDYASSAVRLHAFEYLLKPFDPQIMEAALKKIISKRNEEYAWKNNKEYGIWYRKNQKQMQLRFWHRVLSGQISMSGRELEEEITRQKLHIDMDARYRLIISKVTESEQKSESIHSGLLVFILENVHSEILDADTENKNVICFDYKDYYVVAAICKEKGREEVEQLCTRLNREIQKIDIGVITTCISRVCRIEEFYDVFCHGLENISSNLSFYGSWFHENENSAQENRSSTGLELSVMENMLNEKKKMDFMHYLRSALEELVKRRMLTEAILMQIKQEILQVVYSHLASQGIQASCLFTDDTLSGLSEKSSRSMTDMVRFTNILLERAYFHEEELEKKHSMIEKINQYIKEHYMEDIGRNEIAGVFYLTPEYLGKMYKKQTGIRLKEYIFEVRIEKAKKLLKKKEVQVSDVAEAVGFENFTYFSTIFKKITGMAPNQYKKSQ